jgi:hypothetical protein
MGLVPDATIAAMRGDFNLGIFFRLATTPNPLNMWWGISDIPAQIPGVDIGGTIYQGAGMMAEVPDALEVLLNGASERVDFTMSGVDPTLVAQLADTAPVVTGKRAHLGFAILDERWQPKTAIFVPWTGYAEAWADTLTFPSKETDYASSTITLITTSGSPARSVANLSTYTDRIQQLISATDKFCERTPNNYQQRYVRWPHYGS